MGNFIVSALKVINCDSCSKDVCNAMSIHSNCSDCCSFDVTTEAIEVAPDDDSNISVEIDNCCSVHKS